MKPNIFMVASAQSARSLFLRRVRQSRVGAVLAPASLPRALAARDPRLGTADLLSEFLLSGAPPRRLRRLAPPGAGGEAVQSSLVGLLSAVRCQMSVCLLSARVGGGALRGFPHGAPTAVARGAVFFCSRLFLCAARARLRLGESPLRHRGHRHALKKTLILSTKCGVFCRILLKRVEISHILWYNVDKLRVAPAVL